MALLKSTLSDWKTETYDNIVATIKTELLVQHLVLTKRATLLSMAMEKGENLMDFLTRVESQASVCNIESGLQKEDILLLCMLRATNQDTRTKILQFFVQKGPTEAALKVYADNIRSSECKLSEACLLYTSPSPRD